MKRSVNLSIFWNLNVLGNVFLFHSTFELARGQLRRQQGPEIHKHWRNVGGSFLAAPLSPVFIPPSSTLRTFAQEHAKQKALSLLCPHCSSKHVQVSSLLCSVSPASQPLSYSKYNLSCHWESDELSFCWCFMENVSPFVAFSHCAKDLRKESSSWLPVRDFNP